MSDMSSVSPSSTALTPASASISDSSHSMSPSSASAGGSRVPGGSADADPQEREIAGTSTGGRMGPGAGEGDGGGGETSSVVVPRLEHQTGASAGASSSIEVGPSGRTDPSLVQEGERPVDGRDEAGSGSRSGTHQPLSGMGQPEPSKQDTQAPEPGAESEGGGGDDGLNPELPELPWAFIECPTDDLIVLIGELVFFARGLGLFRVGGVVSGGERVETIRGASKTPEHGTGLESKNENVVAKTTRPSNRKKQWTAVENELFVEM